MCAECIGPGAMPDYQCRDPLAKIRQRADRIATTRLSAARRFTAYARQVVPTLSYVSKLGLHRSVAQGGGFYRTAISCIP